jgi:exodeoxyribonuclease V alpha subunit
VTDALDRIAEAEAADAIDLALGRLLAGLDAEHALREGRAGDPERARALALTGALVSRARRDGHAAVALDEHAGRPFPEDEHARPAFRGLPRLPDAPAWRRHLEASPVAGGAASTAPLVLDRGRVAFRRFVDAERRVAEAVAARLGADEAGPSPAAREAFAALFPPRADGSLDRQALAAAAALRQRALFVAGGPGTGKTYTAARLLALALADVPTSRVALAAPTGKAAARLSESVADALDGLGALGETVPTEAVTLHRLLGAHPERAGFHHDARRPLPHDLVLVDEGSMVDLPLFDALLAALRPEARLAVLGDPDQLAPVEAGTPFADVCALATGGAPPGLVAFCGALGLDGVPADAEASPLDAAVVRLTESRRFTADSDVGALATAIRTEDVAAALAVLDDDRRPGVRLVEDDPAASALAWALPFARDVVRAETADDALAALGRFRLLAAVRRGPRGVEGLNAAVEGALQAGGLVRWNPYAEPFYRGRPVLVTVNDRETGLQNGDVGVCGWRGGGRVVVFPEHGAVPYGRLPAREPAWALTVHKSQGSEFDAVGVVLPEPGTRGAGLLTRELLYTATTRARRSVALFGGRGQVERAVAHRQRRTSGLADRLAGAAGRWA